MENFSPLPFALPELHAVAIPGATAKLKHRLDNTKRKGDLSEAAFLLKAASLGFGVAKPWGDSERYDFILDSHNDDHHTGAPSKPDFGLDGDFNLATPPSHAPTLSSRATILSSRAKSRELA